MGRLSISKCLAVFFCVAFVVGCAGGESFKRGEQLAAERRWDEAIEFYQKALEENPSSKEYKESLEKARQESAKIHFEKAKQLMPAEKQADITRLEQVVKEADLAYKLDPQNKAIAAFYEDVNRKKSELQSLVKTLYSQADADLKKDDWLAAIQKLNRINEIFPGYEDTGDKLAQAVQQASGAYYKRGIDLEKQEDWRGATKAFKAVVDINPGYLDAAKRYEEARSRDNVGYCIKAGNAAAQAMDWQRAVMFFERALEYDPSNREVAGQLEKLKEKAAKSLFDQAIKDVQRGKIYQGAKKLELAKTYLPSLQEDTLFKEFVAGNLGVKLVDRAEQYAEKGKWGNALIALQQLEALDPNYKGLFFKIQEAKDNIKKRIRKSIAIFDFKSPSSHKDAGRIVANKLMTFLYKNASGDIRIIERENLESILKELQLGQTGLVDVDTMKALSKMGGIDTFVMGDVLRFTSEYKDFPSMNQVKVVIDEEEVRNPEYVEWLILHKNPSEEDLKTAPPKTVTRKNHQLISYKTGYAKISASIEVSYKLVDARTGENLFTNTVAGRLSKEDKYQDAVPLAGINGDPLELPTETDVLDELTNAKVSEIGQSVLRHFSSLEVEYNNQALLQIKRRNRDEAVERFMDAIFDENMKGISTPVSQSAKEMIDKLTEDM